MKNNDIEKALSSAVTRLVPEDTFDKVTKSIASAEGRSLYMENTTRKNRRSHNWLKAAAAVIVIVTLAFIGAGYYNNNLSVDSIVDIDVNPSIEIKTNKKDVVLDVKALNEEALVILDGMDLKKLDVNVAVNAIIGSMVRNGYLIDGKNGILVSVRNEDETKAHTLRNMILSDINDTLKQGGVSASVINQTVSSDKETEELASKQGISYGKAAFILKLLDKGVELSAEELAKMSLRDIAALILKNDITIKDIIDYDEDDSVLENIKDDIDDKNEENAHKPENAISLDEAKAIALADAGVSGVTFVEAKFEHDDGKNFYELEFRKGGVKYEYEIDAISGSILEKDIEGKREESSSAPEVSEAPKEESKVPETKLITLDEAKAIALADAKFSADEVVFTKEKLFDGARKIYDIEFIADGKEWDYEINAKNGQIMSFDSELEDDDEVIFDTSKDNDNTSKADRISASEAKKIALDHAGFSESDVIFAKVELDNDDGRYVYEVEFIKGRFEYDYEIDATSGNIIEHEKDDFD